MVIFLYMHQARIMTNLLFVYFSIYRNKKNVWWGGKRIVVVSPAKPFSISFICRLGYIKVGNENADFLAKSDASSADRQLLLLIIWEK